MHYLSFSLWLVLLSIMSSSSLYVVPSVRISFFFMIEYIKCHIFFPFIC